MAVIQNIDSDQGIKTQEFHILSTLKENVNLSPK
jgi:hypothetical protein